MLTQKQSELFKYIDSYLKKHGIAPSFEEMKEACGLKSKSGVFSLMKSLIDRGFIEQLPYRARAMSIKKYPEISYQYDTGMSNITAIAEEKAKFDYKSDIINIPVYGKIAAGTPIDALKDTNGPTIPISSSVLGKGNFYALKIEGDSMIEAGIHDGDSVIIKETDYAENGKIVVALVDNQQATLKYLKKEKDKVSLIPANKNYETKTFSADRVKIQGELALLIRNY